MMKNISDWVFIFLIGFNVLANGFEFVEEMFHSNSTQMLSFVENFQQSAAAAYNPLYVGLTLIPGAAAKGAVCLDGTLPGYHLHRGYGSGANSWLVHLEGGGWCNSIRTCVYRKTTRRGSSKYFEKQLAFTGILSNKAQENPDFFNWNRVKIRYCDGASFIGDSEDKVHNLQFRGQKIWLAAMEELMSKGMRYANQRVAWPLFYTVTSSAVYSQEELKSSVLLMLECSWMRVVTLQIIASLAPPSADPHGTWKACQKNPANCSPSQINFLQGFRNQMLNSIKRFSMSKQNGLFINSCFAHCQSERQDTWFADNSPLLGNKAIALAVGDWYFDRAAVKQIDCPYPCDKTCHNLVFRA
ncbi:hypothetical protein L1987_01865 [Smallanthus sonchifolius]|uniref:Uncharacterized protein n=1 Tax=Smallanthus sonchifolius TaxID=185202 RepID=A0ACB9K688_9ASTR|nr:hypothetical protein L1987_01865 [Smallanthus sonchifolius]